VSVEVDQVHHRLAVQEVLHAEELLHLGAWPAHGLGIELTDADVFW
jgi:hypothetical protein